MRPKSGTIRLSDEDVTGIYADGIARRGAVLVPEGRRIFPDLTVRDNLRLGGYSRTDADGVESDIGGDGVVLSHTCRKARREGFGLERRTAADAGDCARPDGEAQDSDSRRAVARPRADHRPRSALNHSLGAQQVRRGGAARGAERGAWRLRSPIAATSCRTAALSPRARSKSCEASTWCARPISATVKVGRVRLAAPQGPRHDGDAHTWPLPAYGCPGRADQDAWTRA